MEIYKFGGASVKDAAGIRNLAQIVENINQEPLVVVVSAMGKTTNQLEKIHSAYDAGSQDNALLELQQLERYHFDVLNQLIEGDDQATAYSKLNAIFQELKTYITSLIDTHFDKTYDKIVSYGEVLSTTIVSLYLNHIKCSNTLLDMRQLLITDNQYRDANINYDESARRIKASVSNCTTPIIIVQGFIGGTIDNQPTTLGREGSDYTAAMLANILDAKRVTIWKDVPGVLNADPKLFDNTVHIPEMTYSEAVELAFSGAQIIHPKTIRPLENKGIALFVKPFTDPQNAGTVIKRQIAKPINVPVYIVRKNQVLLTIRPKDFSFVLESTLPKLFTIIEQNKLKVSLIQSSAITISVSVDNSRNLFAAIEQLQKDYQVSYNDGLTLLTVRGTTPQIIKEVEQGKEILLKQTTRRTIKLLYR